MERLQKVLAQAGVASRRKCEDLIRAGRVKVNGQVVSEVGCKVDPLRDRLEVNGKAVASEQKVVLLFYKPLGVITSLHDPQGRRTVRDFVAKEEQRLFPVGRLDYQTEGLLLMTNDGELAERLTHPRYKMEKEYLVTVKGTPSEERLQALRQGVLLDGRKTAPAKVRRLGTEGNGLTTRLSITLREGRNRQIRRMCEQIGHPVIALKRVRFGFLTLDGLHPGEYRRLSPEEISQLRHFCGLR